MKKIRFWSYQWVYILTVILFSLAVILRSLLIYDQAPDVLMRDFALLAVWLALFLGEPATTRRWRFFFPIYLVIQTALIVLLLLSPGTPDYFAILFALLSMRIFQYMSPRNGAIWVAAFSLISVLPLAPNYGLAKALALGLVYSAADALTALFSITTHRSEETQVRNQAMQAELQEKNLRLKAYSEQLKQLAVAHERNRLARELHDSVTQTVFSMTLITQSALLLLDREPAQTKMQVNQLSELTRSAIAEMQTLISQLSPQTAGRDGLAALLRQHLDERRLPQNLSVTLDVEGEQSLTPAEQQAIFRIIQEALNNIVKHAQASRASLHLHLNDPQWIEIMDNGQGFWPNRVEGHGGIGLSSMRERAVEIGWSWTITSSPGSGTRICVRKGVPDGRN